MSSQSSPKALDELNKIFSDICNSYVALRQRLIGKGLSEAEAANELMETVEFTPEDLPLESEEIVELATKTAASLHQLLIFMNRAAPETGSSIMMIFDAMKLVRKMRTSCLLIAYLLSARDEEELPAEVELVSTDLAVTLVEKINQTRKDQEADPED